jgi:hypothetical protein
MALRCLRDDATTTNDNLNCRHHRTLSACEGFLFSPKSVARGALHPFFQNAPFPPKSNKTAPAAKPLSACQGEIIKMAPSRVDSNKKRAKSLIGQVEEELFCIGTMARTVSGPSQATVHLADKTPQDLYYECLDEGEAWQFPIPKM